MSQGPKIRIWLYLAASVLLAALLTRAYWPSVSGDARRAFAGVTLPVRMAELYGKEPDRTVSLPIRGIRIRQIADTWGAPRPGDRTHQGQDIFAPRGTAIYSATEGYVVRVGENRLGGNTVSVMGAGGRVYYYAHLDSHAPGLGVGDRVTTETLLGYVGTTGNARGTPPHLHFGVYTPAGAINPLPLLAERVVSPIRDASSRADFSRGAVAGSRGEGRARREL